MSTASKILKTITSLIQVNEKMNALSTRIDMLIQDVSQIDKRLIRTETWIEFSTKNAKIKKRSTRTPTNERDKNPNYL